MNTEGIDLPAIPLEGGPYDGETTAALSAHDRPSHGVLFFPDRVHVSGPDGLALYRLRRTDEGPVGDFDSMA